MKNMENQRLSVYISYWCVWKALILLTKLVVLRGARPMRFWERGFHPRDPLLNQKPPVSSLGSALPGLHLPFRQPFAPVGASSFLPPGKLHGGIPVGECMPCAQPLQRAEHGHTDQQVSRGLELAGRSVTPLQGVGDADAQRGYRNAVGAASAPFRGWLTLTPHRVCRTVG